MEKTTITCEEDILCGVNLPKDEKNLTELEILSPRRQAWSLSRLTLLSR